MGQYTPTTISENATILGAGTGSLDAEFAAIATAHNEHAETDFSGHTHTTIPLSAMFTPNSYFTFSVESAAEITGSVASGTVQAYYVVPFDCTLVRAKLCRRSLTGSVFAVVRRIGDDEDHPVVFPTEFEDSTFQNDAVLGCGQLNAGDVLTLGVIAGGGEVVKEPRVVFLAKSQHEAGVIP